MRVEAGEAEGDLRDGAEFRFVKKVNCQAPSTFTVVAQGMVIVTRRFSNLFKLPDDTPIVAHWHGQYRTEAFLSTLGKLKAKAKEQGML